MREGLEMSAPKCINSVHTDQNGRVVWLSACAWCLKEQREEIYLRHYCRSLRFDPEKISHGICQAHADAMPTEKTVAKSEGGA